MRVPLYYFTEPSYQESSWCCEILEGLNREGRRKRIPILPLSAETVSQAEPGSNVVLIGSTFYWLQSWVRRFQNSGLRPIVLSNQPQNSFDGEYSSVGIDIPSSMQAALRSLRSLGNQHTALYGVNRRSLSDRSREDAFHRLCPDGGVFLNDGSLEECFARFFPVCTQYDSVVCTNDFAALSLVRRLQEQKPEFAKKLSVISYSSTHLAHYSSPPIPSLSMNFGDFGKAAILIHTTLQHSYLSSIHAAVRWTFSTDVAPVSGTVSVFSEYAELPAEEYSPDVFYDDPELRQMLHAEHLLWGSDATDLKILAGLMDGIAYDQIAASCFLSPNGVKYRIRKMMELCQVTSRSALTDFLVGYLDRTRLPDVPDPDVSSPEL